MRLARYGMLTAAFVGALITLPAGHAQGLYGDEGKNVTSGDLDNQDYWWSKYDAMMLELAIRQHQPEGRIGVNLAIFMRRLDDLSKKYPQHQEIAKWKARAHEVDAKINPDAPRNVYFTPECPWDESNFAQLWVNLHWAKTAFDAKDYSAALSCMQNVMQNYAIMLKPDRMKDYPEELRSYVVNSKPDADKFYVAVKAKNGR
jgi:hypothetical protein